MTRVLPLSDRETLLGSHGSFVGKKRKNRIPFDNKELFLIQMLKILFVCSFWSWIKCKEGWISTSMLSDVHRFKHQYAFCVIETDVMKIMTESILVTLKSASGQAL